MEKQIKKLSLLFSQFGRAKKSPPKNKEEVEEEEVEEGEGEGEGEEEEEKE